MSNKDINLRGQFRKYMKLWILFSLAVFCLFLQNIGFAISLHEPQKPISVKEALKTVGSSFTNFYLCLAPSTHRIDLAGISNTQNLSSRIGIGFGIENMMSSGISGFASIGFFSAGQFQNNFGGTTNVNLHPIQVGIRFFDPKSRGSLLFGQVSLNYSLLSYDVTGGPKAFSEAGGIGFGVLGGMEISDGVFAELGYQIHNGSISIIGTSGQTQISGVYIGISTKIVIDSEITSEKSI